MLRQVFGDWKSFSTSTLQFIFPYVVEIDGPSVWVPNFVIFHFLKVTKVTHWDFNNKIFKVVVPCLSWSLLPSLLPHPCSQQWCYNRSYCFIDSLTEIDWFKSSKPVENNHIKTSSNKSNDQIHSRCENVKKPGLMMTS